MQKLMGSNIVQTLGEAPPNLRLRCLPATATGCRRQNKRDRQLSQLSGRLLTSVWLQLCTAGMMLDTIVF